MKSKQDVWVCDAPNCDEHVVENPYGWLVVVLSVPGPYGRVGEFHFHSTVCAGRFFTVGNWVPGLDGETS